MKKLDPVVIHKISVATDTNDHTYALIRLARALDEQFLVHQLSILDGQHRALGYMNEELNQQRRTYSRWLMSEAQVVFDNFDAIQAAF